MVAAVVKHYDTAYCASVMRQIYLRVIKVLGSKGPWCEARGMSVEGVDCVRLTLFNV